MDSSAVVTPPYVAGPLRLEPFRALRLRPSRIGDPASARLYSRPYRSVGRRLSTWIDRGDVLADDEPALYVHEYTDNGMTVRGVVGSLDVSRRAATSAEAAVLPHEGVHPRQASVLAERLGEMELQPAPILLTQESPQEVRSIVDKEAGRGATWCFDDRGGQRHRIWAIRDTDTITALNDAWAGSRALIADGHHRYAAYLDAQSRHPGSTADTGLAMVVDQVLTPLHLGAVHRSLHGITLAELIGAAEERHLSWCPTKREPGLAALAPGTLVATDGRNWARVTLPGRGDKADVEYVHEELVPALPRQPHHIGYHHSVEEALQRADQGHHLACLLPAPTIDQVWRTVTHDRLLPEKATSFQPKPHPGVLMRSLHDAPSTP